MASIVAFFSNEGVPATGLAATIRIRRLDDQTLVATDLAFTEVGDGGYSFDFAPVDGVDYSIRADGGVTLGDSDRYQYGSISGRVDKVLGTEVDEIYRYHGLQNGVASVHTPTSIDAGAGISMTVDQSGTTLTKQRV